MRLNKRNAMVLELFLYFLDQNFIRYELCADLKSLTDVRGQQLTLDLKIDTIDFSRHRRYNQIFHGALAQRTARGSCSGPQLPGNDSELATVPVQSRVHTPVGSDTFEECHTLIG